MPTNLHAKTSTLIKTGTPAPSRVTSSQQIRNSNSPYAQGLATDLDNLSQTVNSLHNTLASKAPALSQILLTDSQGSVIAAFGDFVYEGTYFTNYLNELHVGDPLGTHDPQEALFNANVDGSVTIGQNGWLDILDPYGDSAAWLGTQNDSLTVTGAANNGAGLVRLTVVGHTLATGNEVRVQEVGGVGTQPEHGNFVSNATGYFVATVVDANHIDLQESVWAGTYTSGGRVDRVLQVTGAVNNGTGQIRIQTAVPHLYQTGDRAVVLDVGGVPDARGVWNIKVIDATHFDLLGSSFANTYTSGGTALRFFSGMLAQTIAIGASFDDYRLRAFNDGSLRIRNAIISLSSASGEILLDPNTLTLSLSNTASDARIELNAAVPSLTLYDQQGNQAVVLEVLQQAALTITATTHGTPDQITVPGHTYVEGDSVFIKGALGDTAINGYRLVKDVSGSSFKLTDLSGADIHGSGTYTGGGTCARYYAGLLAQTLAIGNSFTDYKLRAFADGQMVINGAKIENSDISGGSFVQSGLSILFGGGGAPQTSLDVSNSDGSFTSTYDPTGAGTDVLTLRIIDGQLNVSGTGTQSGHGDITIDGTMHAGRYAASGLAGFNGTITGLTALSTITVTQGIITSFTA